MIKRIKKYGNTLVIVISKEDVDLYGIKEDDIIEFGEISIKKKEETKI